jgi:hypothetical protein
MSSASRRASVPAGLAAAAAALLAFSCARPAPRAPVPADYATWERTTAAALDYPVPGHEEHHRRIFINRIGQDMRSEVRQGRVVHDYPEGTVLVKEVYEGLEPRPGEAPFQLTVMIKRPKDPLARGGWLWVVRDMASGQEKLIDYEFCFDCHASANEPHPYGDRNPRGEFRDYVFFPYRK